MISHAQPSIIVVERIALSNTTVSFSRKAL
jgi:hypothetical protein